VLQASAGAVLVRTGTLHRATVLYAYQFVLRRHKVGWWARFFTVLASSARRCRSACSLRPSAPPTDRRQPADARKLGAGAAVLRHGARHQRSGVRDVLDSLAVLFMAAAQILGHVDGGIHMSQVDVDLVNNWRVGFHVALIVFGNAGFAFGAVSAGLYLWQEGQLKAHKSNIVTRRLPSLAPCSSSRAVPSASRSRSYTAGLLLGVLRAIDAQVPRLVVRRAHHDVGRRLADLRHLPVDGLPRRGRPRARTSWLAVFGFVLVVILAVIARTVPVGFHVFGL